MKERPLVLVGKTIRYQTTCGGLYITLNRDDKGELQEICLTLGKSGNCITGFLEFIGILLSIIFQMDLPTEEKIKTLQRHAQGISCGEVFIIDGKKYKSCLDLIGEVCINELKSQKKK